MSSDADHRDFGLEIGALIPDSAGGGLDAIQDHYIRAYSASDLKTFHCDRVRKLPLSGLDPSMLIGFLCKDEDDWLDFRQRAAEVRGRFVCIGYRAGLLCLSAAVADTQDDLCCPGRAAVLAIGLG